jgi:cell division protease FtsH
LADLAVAFGGYSAEQEVFGDISTGASGDLKMASDMARKMVVKYGMSDKFGPITFGKTEELVFLGKEISTEKNYSEETALEIDKEVQKIIQKAYKAAREIIRQKRKVLDAIAKQLIEKETIEKEEFDLLIKRFGLKQIEI